MRHLLTALLFLPLMAIGQSETHNMTTYDTTISIFTPPYGPTNTWIVRITRPVNLFTAGSPDTASRPAIITMPGEGQQGNSNTSNLVAYGPHYWLANGWNGAVQLGNGTHYPLLFTICYVNEDYTNVPDVYNVVDTLLKYYHIKPNGRHYMGLSEGAFTWGSLVAYETTPGAQTGMQIMTSLVAMEGTPNPSLVNPNNTLGIDTPLYKIWTAKYHGRYFYLEGTTDNFRNGWQYSTAMNDTVAGTAYFSYEGDQGGGHCCWNDFYNPATVNWTCVNPPGLGTYNAPSQSGGGTNTMGTYGAPANVYQWALRQGDTTLVGSGESPPNVSAGSNQTITLPVNSVTLAGSATPNLPAISISAYTWSQVSGPLSGTFSSTSIPNPTFSGLIAGTYVLQMSATDNEGNSASANVSIIVNPNACNVYYWDTTKRDIVISRSTYPTLHACDSVKIPTRFQLYNSEILDSLNCGIIGPDSSKPAQWITIWHQPSGPGNPGALIGPFYSPQQINKVDSVYGVHRVGFKMDHNIDPAVSHWAPTGRISYFTEDYDTLTSVNGYFPSSSLFYTLPNFTGDSSSSLSYHVKFLHGFSDSCLGGVSGLNWMWWGGDTSAASENQYWTNVEVAYNTVENYSSVSDPANYLHIGHTIGLHIHDNKFVNLGLKSDTIHEGHASDIFTFDSQGEIDHNLFANNFGTRIRTFGWVALLSGWLGDTTLVHDNLDTGSIKYSFEEQESKITIYSPLVTKLMPAPDIEFITMTNPGIGVGQSPYKVAILENYDSMRIEIKYCVVTGCRDSVFTAAFGPFIETNSFSPTPTNYDTLGNQLTQTLSASGIANFTTMAPVQNGPLFNSALYGNPDFTTDYYYNAQPNTGHPGYAGAVQYISTAQTGFYFNASTGIDTGHCLLAHPCLTLNYLNSLPLVGGDTVYFNRGNTFPGVFRCNYSGTTGNPIVYTAYGSGAEPVWGGMLTLSPSGSGPIYTAACAGCTANTNLLTVDGKLQSKGTTPNAGSYYTFIPSRSSTTTLFDSLDLVSMPANSLVGMTICIRTSPYTWNNVVVTAQTSTTLTFTPAVPYVNVGGNGWFVIGSTPNAPYEWAYSGGAGGTVSIYMPSGYVGHVIQVPATDTMVYTQGQHLVFDHLNIQGGNLIVFHAAFQTVGDITFSYDSLSYGGIGFLGRSTPLVTFNHCNVSHHGDGGIVGENPAANKYSVLRSRVYDIGMLPGMGGNGAGHYIAINPIYNQPTAYTTCGDSTLIKFDSIYNVGYNAISISGNNSHADSNVILYFCQNLEDGGAIYWHDAQAVNYPNERTATGNYIAYGGSSISHLGTNVANYSSAADGGYCDAFAQYVTFSGNTVDSVNSNALYTHDGNNQFLNNTTFGSGFSEFTAFEYSGGPIITNLVVTGNNFGGVSASDALMRLETVNNDLLTFGTVNGNHMGHAVLTAPLYMQNAAGGSYKTLAQWQSAIGDDGTSTLFIAPLSFIGNASPVSGSYPLGGIYKTLSGTVLQGTQTIAGRSGLIISPLGTSQKYKFGGKYKFR